MAPKKKTKSNKLANMSEEERLRYLQHKATMEEEAHRRKQQIIATYMNIKLKHEELFSRLNSAKINQQWRHILRKIKCEKLREDILDLEQHYEEVLKHKNELISRFLKDFDRAEFQYSLQFQEHMETISKFLRLHDERLQRLHSWYTEQVDELRNKNVEKTQTMLTAIEEDFESIRSKQEEAKQEYAKKLESAESTLSEKKNDLQTKLLYKSVKEEEKYADELAELQQEYNDTLKQYKANTDGKLAHYRILSQKDNDDSADIVQYYRTIEDNIKRIETKRNELEDLREVCRNKENHLNSRKLELAEELQNLRQQYEQNRKIDHDQLKLLVNSSNSVLKDLNTIRNSGDRILHLMNHCAKLEQGDEKKIPPQEIANETSDNIFSILQNRLGTFWKICNGVRISNETLLKTRIQAQDENVKLKQLLRYHVSSFRRKETVSRKCGF